jgi:hypothetical protein
MKDFILVSRLLEGEGSFLAPPPSSPNSPRLARAMTDQDVVERVAEIWGVGYCSASTKRHRERGWKPAWIVAISGRRAVEMMRLLYPLMSKRRQAQIDHALSCYAPDKQARRLKYSDEQVATAKRRLLVDKAKPKDVAEETGLSIWTVYDVKRGRNRARIKV